MVVNTDEKDLSEANKIEGKWAKILEKDKFEILVICAKLEEELSSLTKGERLEYLMEHGIKSSGLDRLITKAYHALRLISFLTAGEIEVKAWTIKKGISASSAAGVVHSDFEKNFIKADVVDINNFIKFEGWKKCRELGKVRVEGKDYIVKDGDVIEFRIGT